MFVKSLYDVAKEIPICYLLIMKCIYANLIFASDFNLLSDSVAFTSSVHPDLENMREVNILIC